MNQADGSVIPKRISSKRATYNADYPTVPRCMAFVDVSSFTSFTHTNGSRAAAARVADFRAIIRTTTGKHGIRVARWLGDGAMLVGLSARSVLEALYDIADQCQAESINLHAGVADGEVIIFEGDDYLGRTLNIAARLSNLASDSEAYCHNINPVDIPPGYWHDRLHDVSIRGAGNLPEVIRLRLA